MPDPVTIAAGIQVVGAIFGFGKQRKAAKAAKAANKLEQQRRAIGNVVARRQAAAALRRSQEQAVAQAVASGANGSVARNVNTNLGTQTSSNIGKQEQLEGIDVARNRQVQNVSKYKTQADNISVVTNVASTAVTGFKSLSATESNSNPLSQEEIDSLPGG